MIAAPCPVRYDVQCRIIGMGTGTCGGEDVEQKHIVEIIDRNVCAKMDMTREYGDAELKQLIVSCMDELERRIPGLIYHRDEVQAKVYNGRRRLGIIQPLLDDPEINEIMINGTDGIYIERNGRLECYSERYTDKEKLFHIIQIMASWANRTVNESNPIVDARLSDGSRMNVVLNPVAINGPAVTIRKFAEQAFTMEYLIRTGSIRAETAEYLKSAVSERKNIIISGGTSSGKTTFLNVLAGFIPQDQRIVSIEDSAELKLTQPNMIRMEMRNANTEGKGEIKMRTLIKTALRMRPDRLLIGEVRDESALDMLTALCTGHDGSMSTAHANSAADLLVRLETMALWEGHVSSWAIKRMIASGVHLIVHLQRDGIHRSVKEIAEVCGFEKDEIRLRIWHPQATCSAP